jgi:hypothetical protein
MVGRYFIGLLLLTLSGTSAHGTLQFPFPWQQGNIISTWRHENVEAAWGSGYPLWFTNYTHLPDGIKPTINDPKLRTYTDEIPGGGTYDWSARSPWRAPGTAKVYSPCGSEGGNPDGCIQEDGITLGPCVTDGAGFAYGIDGLSLAGNGIATFWQAGSTVEVGWTDTANHGGGYSYRLARKPASGNYSELTEESFQAMDFGRYFLCPIHQREWPLRDWRRAYLERGPSTRDHVDAEPNTKYGPWRRPLPQGKTSGYPVPIAHIAWPAPRRANAPEWVHSITGSRRSVHSIFQSQLW